MSETGMSAYRIDQEDYWDHYPAGLKGMRDVVAAQGMRITVHVLGDPSNEQAPTAIVLKMPPNCDVPRHAHDCERLELVLEGTIGSGDWMLGPGDIMKPGYRRPYGPFRTGPEGCTTVEFFSTRAGAHAMLFEGPDGMNRVDLASNTATEAIAQL
jgi:hypothetical protein